MFSKIFQNSPENTCVGFSFLIKLQASRLATLLKKKFLRTLFYRTSPAAASVWTDSYKSVMKILKKKSEAATGGILLKKALRLATLLKKRLWHKCFPMSFAKFLRAPFLQNTSGEVSAHWTSNGNYGTTFLNKVNAEESFWGMVLIWVCYLVFACSAFFWRSK